MLGRSFSWLLVTSRGKRRKESPLIVLIKEWLVKILWKAGKHKLLEREKLSHRRTKESNEIPQLSPLLASFVSIILMSCSPLLVSLSQPLTALYFIYSCTKLVCQVPLYPLSPTSLPTPQIKLVLMSNPKTLYLQLKLYKYNLPSKFYLP